MQELDEDGGEDCVELGRLGCVSSGEICEKGWDVGCCQGTFGGC